jgi:integrase
MSLYKRKGSPYWWIRFTHKGRRIQQSSGTCDRSKAHQFHDRLKSQLWEEERLQKKPSRIWDEAVVRWLRETSHKATRLDDVAKLRWLDQFLRGKALDQISRDLLSSIAESKERESTQATANRYMALVRAMLRRAANDWEWIDRVPKVRMFKEAKRRVRWLTPEQAETLLSHLPVHQADIVRFALATGLRQGNVTRLEWSQIDMQRRVAWIHADQAKSRKAIFVPLNEAATAVIRRQIGKHDERVFTYRGNPVGQVNTAAWRRALSKAGIENFRWHDLRHTWASWHVQAGTPVNELQELGGWESVEMVRRYAHLASGNLANAAARIEAIGTKMATATPVLSAVG